MKLLAVAATALAAFSTAAAQTTQVGCRALDTKNDGLLTELLHNPSARGAADPDLRYGFWDAKWRKCCNEQNMCDRYYTFSYNHPYPWAYRQRRGTIRGQQFDFACVNWHTGACILVGNMAYYDF
nr:hypothetical protein g2317 [Fusarium commune]